MPKRTFKRYIILEGGEKILLETSDKKETVNKLMKAHRTNPKGYHEVYELHDGRYLGVRQLKPDDENT